MKRKVEVELLRFWFTIAVCLHHLRYCTDILPYGGGYMGVDFFCAVTGFYMYKHIISKNIYSGKSMYQYMKVRYWRLFKDYISAFILAMAVNLLWFNKPFGNNWWNYCKEAFMLEVGGVASNQRMNPPDWYCGYLLIGSLLVYGLILEKIIRKHIGLISFGISLGGYIFLGYVYHHINIFPLEANFNWYALLRIIAGLSSGIVLYKLLEYSNTKKIEFGKIWYWLCGGLFCVATYMLYWDTAYKITDFFCIIVLFILFYFSQVLEIPALKLIDEKIRNNISQLTYIMFLNHYSIVKLFSYYNLFQYGDWKVISLVYIVTVFLLSEIMLIIKSVIFKNY